MFLKSLEFFQHQPKYYNTSAFLGSGTYGPLVRPPSPPPPLAEAERDDDLDMTTKRDNGNSEINYISTLDNSTTAGEPFGADGQPDEYLEPRARSKLGLNHALILFFSRVKLSSLKKSSL